MIISSVPVALVEPKSVLVVFIIHGVFHVVHLLKRVVIGPVLFIHLLEAFLPIEGTPGIVLVPMTFILLEEVAVVGVITHAVPHSLLLSLSLVHPFRPRLLSLVLPVGVLVLVVEAGAGLVNRALTKDQTVVLFAQVCVTQDRVSFSNLLESLFMLLGFFGCCFG